MNFVVLQFPGSNCDQDVVHVLRNVLGHSARLLWHKESSLGDANAVIVPGGFSYGDYLRTGAIARFSPVMRAVQEFATQGGLVLGICNGFQILCEAGLLPGALIRNRSLQFRCEHVFLKTDTPDSPFTRQIPAGKIYPPPHRAWGGLLFCRSRHHRRPEETRPDSVALLTPRANRPKPPTQTARWTTSQASVTRHATSPASCLIPNVPAKPSLAVPMDS